MDGSDVYLVKRFPSLGFTGFCWTNRRFNRYEKRI